jgi:AcrR family transcriptional regulator
MQKRKDTLVRQKEIVNAARKIIVKYGSEHVTVRRIAKEIGITEGAVYRHFKSKREILLLLAGDIEETLINDIDKNFNDGDWSHEYLEKIILEHISAIEQRRGVTFQVIAEIISLGDKKLNSKVYGVICNYIERIKKILAEGVSKGQLRSDVDIDAAAKLYFGMTQGLVNVWALSQYSFNLEKEYKPVWNTFIQAISPTDTNAFIQREKIPLNLHLEKGENR